MTKIQRAETDANFVLTGSGGLVEFRAPPKARLFSEEEFLELLKLARKGVGELVTLQKEALR